MIMISNTVFQFAGMVMCMTVLVSAGPTCLECADVVAPTDCEFVRTCGDHEKCFLDTFVTSGGAIRFTMGCRDTKQCTSSAGKRDIDRERRSNGDVLVCNACCDNKAMCNNALCQTKGYPTARGPICFNCKDQNGTNDCQMITMCGQDEMCMLHITSNSVTHAQRYETKCEPIQQCLRSVNTMHQSIGIIGKRTSNAVELYGKCMIQCCDGDLCNNNCLNTGGSIINILTTTPRPVTVDHCHSSPCHNGGICTSSSTSFSCRCATGFTGSTCTTHVNHCSPNPCIHGTCHSSSSGYTCSCDATYYGNNCQTKDYCANTPCIHGSCTNHASSYSCHCNSGYTGNTCDQRVVNHCSPNPCIHGTCHSSSSGYTCSCHATYYGNNCQTKDHCANNPCPHGYCTNHASSFTCHCDRGYTGNTCDQRDYCAIDHCQHGACVNMASSYKCNCYSGYTGTNCQTAVSSHSPLSVGDKVVPGPDWFLDEKVSIGTVTRMNDLDHPQSVWVLWNTGLITVSQYGHNGKYEVVHA